MIVNHNMMAMNTHRQLGVNTDNSSKSIEKLSSGLRINRAGDDAAGLAISEKMRGQVRGLDQASRNAQDSISLIQTAEGALTETHSILQRMRELAVQSSNDTNTTTDRESLQDEMTQLTKEVDRIANTTEFNTKKLLNGDLDGGHVAKKGVVETEGSFANGNVKLGTVTNASLATVTDVIKISITKDTFSDASSLSATGVLSENQFEVSTVLGQVDSTKVIISGGSNIVISGAAAAISNSGDIEEISIALTAAQMKALKSGDTITISIKKREDATTSGKEAIAQIGANVGQELGIGISDMGSKELGVRKADGTALDITTQANASGGIKFINNAIEKVSTERSKLGSLQNRLEHTIKNLDTSSENLQAAESRIADVDMAKEMVTFSKNNILQQAAQSMLAQANQAPQGVLALLR